MSVSLFDRVKYLCNEKSITINKLEKELGFGMSAIVKWKKQNPSSDKILKVADYFNVTTDYLLGLTDNPYKFETTNDRGLLEIQEARELMSDEERIKMMQLLKLTFNHVFKENKDEDII